MPTRRRPIEPMARDRRTRNRGIAWLSMLALAMLLAGSLIYIYLDKAMTYAEFYPTPIEVSSPLVSQPSVRLDSVGDCEGYYRRNLSSRAKAAYDAMESGIRRFSPVIYLPDGTTAEEARVAIRFMLADNPDIFWCDGRGSCKRGDGDEAPVFTMEDEPSCVYASYSPLYLRNESQSKTELSGYHEIAKNFFSDESPYAPARGKAEESDSDKLHLIFCYLADRLEYRHMTPDDQSIASALGSDESVCAGYSKAACFIARANGIPCIYIGGEAINGIGGANGNHAWIAANLDGDIAFCDPLWFDNIEPGRGFYDIKWFDSDEKLFRTYHRPFYPDLAPVAGDQESSSGSSATTSDNPETSRAFSSSTSL